ncbi:MAG: aminoglycoside phosphotransferase family protein [Pirellulaceae bacterium]
MDIDTARTVIGQFYRHQIPSTSPAIEDLGAAGGFSGANLWRIVDADRVLCLRRWPRQQVDRQQRLTWIHEVIEQAYHSGCSFLAVPLPNANDQSLTSHNGYLWQLEPWMPGLANFRESPSEKKLYGGIQALAQFHEAMRGKARPSRCSPGIMMRRERMAELWQQGAVTERFLQIESGSLAHDAPHGIRPLAQSICDVFRLLAPAISRQLNWAMGVPVEIQPVLGDVWHDHLLFNEQGIVSGIVDYGAMREDTPASDVARLTGSLVGDDAEQWSRALNAWDEAMPSSVLDRELCRVLDHATTINAAVNWLEWICVEKRDFGALEPVFGRLQRLARRMDFLAASM